MVRAFVYDIRSPRWGLAGQGVRFALSGSLVAVVNISATTFVHEVLDVRFQIALAVGTVFSVALHFTLQRLFVWRHREEFALAMHRQALRYLLVCGVQYGLIVLATSRLPGLLGQPIELVYVTTMLAVAGVNFIVFRSRVFHSEPPRQQRLPASSTIRAEAVHPPICNR